MSEEMQLNIIEEKLMSDTALNNSATIEGIKNLIEKTAPLVQAGRFNNIIDLLSIISDNIQFLDEAALEKTTKVGEEILALGWTAGNAIRMANAQTEALEKPPGLLQLINSLNDPDVRRSLHFFIGTMRIIGRQMKND
ncbi:conserved hypothetical protein [Candidatus Nitrotoga sp. HW29]|uniref:DUF1641 domain-containing protein n=1 Tax=Candidatus Nitrotoga sp. HW29 TaxID=2886963 RepID=UPI001EF3D584|nr:DUF1641 domain-containing protein [Candidatus Nitrotoga sp. HW29]CAH1903927.1 conserved hypothetical protein [Candidatus Nitrotoga sp. HW29]